MKVVLQFMLPKPFRLSGIGDIVNPHALGVVSQKQQIAQDIAVVGDRAWIDDDVIASNEISKVWLQVYWAFVDSC